MTAGALMGTLFTNDFSTASIETGILRSVVATGESQVEIGAVTFAGLLSVSGTAMVTLEGSDFAIDGTPVGLGPITATSGSLSGELIPGQSFEVDFARTPTATILLPEAESGWAIAAALSAVFALRRVRSARRF